MKIYGLCLVKNESDIIRACLTAAANWCDRIYVYDNGSTDGTWELVNDLAQQLPQVVPFKQANKQFHDSLRSEIFQAFRQDCSADDWWCRLDADEFYIDDPRVFLAKVPPSQGVVWAASFLYYFTNKDAERYSRDPSTFADDVPVEEKCRYYLNHWAEIRFFRHHEALRWKTGGYPNDIFKWEAYPVRIWVKHYCYRSPQQIQKRLATRKAAIEVGQFMHEATPEWSTVIDPEIMRLKGRESAISKADSRFATTSWEDRIVDASKLQFDAHDRRFVVNEDLMPTSAAPFFRSRRRPVRGVIRRAKAVRDRFAAKRQSTAQ